MNKLLGLVTLAAAMPLAAQNTKSLLELEEFIGDWRISKEFTLAVADKMPPEFYDFRPAEKQMTFGEQMLHIAGASVYRFHQLTGVEPPALFAKRPERPDKATVLRFLNESFDYVIGVLPKVTQEQLVRRFPVDWKGRPEVNGRQMMLNMFLHVAHHRAQAEVYLRLKNIEPPQYTF